MQAGEDGRGWLYVELPAWATGNRAGADDAVREVR